MRLAWGLLRILRWSSIVYSLMAVLIWLSYLWVLDPERIFRGSMVGGLLRSILIWLISRMARLLIEVKIGDRTIILLMNNLHLILSVSLRCVNWSWSTHVRGRTLDLRRYHWSILNILECLRHGLLNKFGGELLKSKGKCIVLEKILGINAICQGHLYVVRLIFYHYVFFWFFDVNGIILKRGISGSVRCPG